MEVNIRTTGHWAWRSQARTIRLVRTIEVATRTTELRPVMILNARKRLVITKAVTVRTADL
jgi:hypothetical protein